jgi:hypothetical protein
LHTLRRHSLFLLSATALIGLVGFFWRWGQHYIDPDATAYLTLARRWVDGDVAKAINGYWSPLGVWLTAGLMKTGLPVMKAAVVQNTVAAVCFLAGALTLFRRFRLSNFLQWSLAAALVVFLAYATYYQLFDDLWMCAALTGSLLILLGEDFLQKPLAWVLLGVCTAFAYYAKAYALPFSFLNIAVCGWILSRAQGAHRIQLLKMLGAVAAVVVALCLPWWMALHQKYGFWTTGTAGTLNLSWYLVGHQTHRADIGLLLPPPYPDAPYHWEDPWAASSRDLPHAWDSLRLMLTQLVRIGFTGLKFVGSLAELSGFALPLWVLGGSLAFSKRLRDFITAESTKDNTENREVRRVSAPSVVNMQICLSILAAQCLTFPALYFFINFESRYLWYPVPILMVIGAIVLNRAFPWLESWFKVLGVVLFSLSFLVWPIWKTREIAETGRYEWQAAQGLRKLAIRGPFVSNLGPDDTDAQSRAGRLAYLSGNAWYCAARADWTSAERLSEMRRYGIRHLYWLDNESKMFEVRPVDESNSPLPELTLGRIPCLRVFLLSPLPQTPHP